MRDGHLAAKFLGKFGLSLANVDPPAPRSYVLVDSGFRGTIGRRLSDRFRELHGVSLLQTGALVVRLMHADEYGSIGRNILELTDTGVGLGLKKPKQIMRRTVEDTYSLAILAQTLPRYFGPYAGLIPAGDDVIAVPDTEDLWQNVDNNGWLNDSVVNPVAAALVQFRVVQAAMQHNKNQSTARESVIARVARALQGVLRVLY